MWKIEKVVSKGDYYYAIVREHPRAAVKGYVLEHRVVMENHLGRLLNPDEVVHHKNGDKKDNRLENLEVLQAKEHTRMHGKEVGRAMVLLCCPSCKKTFTRAKRQSYLQKTGARYTCCSRSCRGKFSRFVQLHGETTEVQRAISGNIVKEFRSFDNPEETD